MSTSEIVSAIDMIFKWSKDLTQLCKLMRVAKPQVQERLVRVEFCSKRLSTQTGLSRSVIDTMDNEYKDLYQQALKIVSAKLQDVHQELNKVSIEAKVGQAETGVASLERLEKVVHNTVLSAKYALNQKKIDNAIDELEKWQGFFDISWLLILKMQDKRIDYELAQMPLSATRIAAATKMLRVGIHHQDDQIKVFLPPEKISVAPRQMPYSEAATEEIDGQLFIIDRVVSISTSKALQLRLRKDIQTFVQKLRGYEPVVCGLLQTKGVVSKQDMQETLFRWSYQILFKVPKGLAEPMSLRKALLDQKSISSLSEAVSIAKQIANAVSLVHLFGFVHKNIQPENIILMRKDDSKSLQACLVGFQHFRSDGGLSSGIGDNDWKKNIYRYPGRHGPEPETYIIQHDIYSLGICLLEIGLWDSFITYDGETPMPAESLAFPTNRPQIQYLGPMKNHFLNLARTRLPLRTGIRYAEVVETCLTCLDESNVDFGNESEFLDDEGIQVGVRYIQKILLRLNTISL